MPVLKNCCFKLLKLYNYEVMIYQYFRMQNLLFLSFFAIRPDGYAYRAILATLDMLGHVITVCKGNHYFIPENGFQRNINNTNNHAYIGL
jgi:hypothetical protein